MKQKIKSVRFCVRDSIRFSVRGSLQDSFWDSVWRFVSDPNYDSVFHSILRCIWGTLK